MLIHLELDQLKLSRFRPKTPLPWPSAGELAIIRQLGFVEPVVARPLVPSSRADYEILSGEKNWLAAQRADFLTVPTVVKNDLDDYQVRQFFLLQNLGQGADPISEARSLQALVNQGLSITAASAQTGRTRTAASHLLRLLRLTPTVQQLVSSGALTVGHAKILVTLAPDEQAALANQISHERLTTRQAEAAAKQLREHAENFDPISTTIAGEHNQQSKDATTIALEQELSQIVGSPATINYAPDQRGSLQLEFSNFDVLDGILARLGYRPE